MKINLYHKIRISYVILCMAFIIQCLLFEKAIYAQSSPIPGTNKGGYSNSVTFDNSNNSYQFKVTSNQGTLTYTYSLNKGYSFNGIKAETNGYSFYPSFFGGVGIVSPVTNQTFYTWTEGVKADLIKSNKVNEAVITEWVISKGSEFYFHYEFNLSVKERSLIIKVKDLGEISNYPVKNYASISTFNLDRCEEAIDPVNVAVPYLTTFNILYTNNLFTSIFFDWTKTNSSQIYPGVGDFSNTSVYYSQTATYNKLTNGKTNKLDETIYLTVSPDLDEVLPNIPNPVSKYKKSSISHLVYDNWDAGFNKIISDTKTLKENGINDLWLIVHNWQNGGYDNKLPDVLPSNAAFGGDNALKELSSLCSSYNYLFSLHENYTDFYPNAESYDPDDVALNFNNVMTDAWKTDVAQSRLLRPSRIDKYLIPISTKINNTFKTSASFVDVLTARNPSDYIDYDYKIDNAGKFTGTFNEYKNAAEQFRKIHNGPVSSEGYNHFLYAGYYDDIAAQILDAEFDKDPNKGGYYRPLLVNFDLFKLHEKGMVHGVGYLERFFLKGKYWQYMGRSKDSILIASATELAYGHGGFFQSNSYNYLEQAKIEYEFVYPMQLLYGDSKVIKVLYNDDGNLITVSEYIKKYPHLYNNIESDKFLSQVYIEYDNGVKIYVNRNKFKNWQIQSETAEGWYNYNALVNGAVSLKTDNQTPGNVVLPASNGWLCYSPNKP